ncbi:LANO_0E06656g1_1 [Lachancea nothofagi CBS 11611]|uniref:Phenylalanine--tRNA ligase, mitochondrial n=1 Tax=Lachancea nothofagi CBS 11611 TaxID=1266666 RepID=A0A1G4JU16_9SACH|nr:LANO_0E06656g1_1 [Lachancea nothofagi CBS 11611]
MIKVAKHDKLLRPLVAPMSHSRTIFPWRRLLLRCYSQGKAQLKINGADYETNPEFTNVSGNILKLSDRSLHLKPSHPIGILRKQIEDKLNSTSNAYCLYNNFRPVVTVEENFDSLGFPPDHPGRSKSDTYYVNNKHLFRTHTSAHEMECFGNILGFSANSAPKDPTDKHGFLISADVYRRDEIDRTHYPVFHQMEGAHIWKRSQEPVAEGREPLHIQKLRADLLKLKNQLQDESNNLVVHDDTSLDGNPKQDFMSDIEVDLCSQHLKRSIELLVAQVFNKKLESMGTKQSENQLKVRWIKAYFPWTAPSWEIEVFWQGEWLELCGCGLVREQVLLNAGYEPNNTVGWAFGLGLDRIAMLLFEIPDIRLFWTLDERFHSQFSEGTISKFKPYSKYPGTVRDVAFWLPQKQDCAIIHENDLMEIVREMAGDLVESVKLIDNFVHPKTGKQSLCYRINYQSMDRNLTNEEINQIQESVRQELVHQYNVTLR